MLHEPRTADGFVKLVSRSKHERIKQFRPDPGVVVNADSNLTQSGPVSRGYVAAFALARVVVCRALRSPFNR